MLEDYAEELKLQGLREATRQRYLELVSDFYNSCKGEPNEENAKNFLKYKMRKGCGGAALRFYYYILKNYFSFLNSEFKDFKFKIPNPPREINRPFFTEEEIAKMLEIARNINLRDYLLLRLFYSSGARRSEIARAEKKDIYIDGEYGRFRIRVGKTEPRVVPIDLETAQGIIEWAKKYSKGGTLFEVTPTQIGNIVRKYRDLAGIKKKGAGCHSYRRSFATHLHDRGMDVFEIKESLGHKTMTMTSIYVAQSQKALAAKHKKIHPLAQSNSF